MFRIELRANVCIGTTGEILRGVKSNRVLREVYAVPRVGASERAQASGAPSLWRNQVAFVQTWNIARPSPSRSPPAALAANLLCPPECFDLSFIHETVSNVFQELANRAARVTSLAHLKFVRFSRIRAWAYLENRVLHSFSFPYICLWERGRFP